MTVRTDILETGAMRGLLVADVLGLPAPLLDALPVGVYFCDRDGTVVRFNRRAAALWGRTPNPGDPAERFCGSYRLYSLDGSFMSHADCPMADCLRTGIPVHDQEAVMERPDGSRIVAAVNIEPIRDESGEIVGAVNCFQDITERKRTETALRDSERQARELIAALPAAIYTTDAAGRITFFNEAAARFWGHRPELGKSEWCGSWKLHWPDGRPMPHDTCPMAVALKEDRAISGGEAVAERPDGTRVPFLAYPTPLHDTAGRLVGAVNMLVDITARKAEEEARAYLAAIVESSDDAIVGKTLNSIVTSWNRGAENLFGYRAEEAIGRSITLIIPPDRLAEEDEIIARLRRGNGVDHFETVRLTKDGRAIDVSLTISPVRDSAGRIIGASKIARDITARKRAEARDRLLLGELSHRVKNTLATVQAVAMQTLRGSDASLRARDAFMGRLMALSKAHDILTKESWEGAMLRELVEEELTPYGGAAAPRFAVDGPDVRLNPNLAVLLGMVFHELATNAAKYGAFSNTAGKVRVAWEQVDGPEPRVRLRWAESGGPPVKKPRRQGFGSRLIEHGLARELNGDVQLRYEPAGVVCVLEFRPK